MQWMRRRPRRSTHAGNDAGSSSVSPGKASHLILAHCLDAGTGFRCWRGDDPDVATAGYRIGFRARITFRPIDTLTVLACAPPRAYSEPDGSVSAGPPERLVRRAGRPYPARHPGAAGACG